MKSTQKILNFEQKLQSENIFLTRNNEITTLQVNIGKRCNLACHHCHVESGPNHPENMEYKTILRLIKLIKNTPSIKCVDITGGAPELNPNFRFFINEITKIGIKVIDRCNLTVLYEKGQEDTAQFLAHHSAEIVASLPCYLEDNVDAQRGKGVFQKSIDALKMLNEIGYGLDENLPLNLVYNPVGEHLPPEQLSLESDYKKFLLEKFDIHFNNLFTITNMPIKRYAHALQRDGKYQEYMQLLIDNFNVNAAKNVMCIDLISIGYDGQIYDCDFNQMLNIPISWDKTTIWDINNFNETKKQIAVANHCYGCTAGCGSSCGGTTI